MGSKKINVLVWCLILTSIRGYAAIDYSLVTVGNPGNLSDPLTHFGQVNYVYQIGKYQVTIEQYTEFLNAIAAEDKYGLYHTNMKNALNVAGIMREGTPGSYVYSVMYNQGYSGKRPITSVSWFNAARFANWMANGQPVGQQNTLTTEDGAYAIDEDMNVAPSKNTINPNTGLAPTYYLPSDNEWYKAAYYNGNGIYYLYATQSNTPPGNNMRTAPNQANYISNETGYCTTQSFETLTTVNYLTDVGSFTSSPSNYGTFDQTGNVWEWNAHNEKFAEYLSIRGAAFTSTVPPYLLSSYYLETLPNEVAINVGFRLAAPST